MTSSRARIRHCFPLSKSDFSKQSTSGFLVELKISEHNMTTRLPVCAEHPPVARELIILPNILQATAQVFFKYHFVSSIHHLNGLKLLFSYWQRWVKQLSQHRLLNHWHNCQQNTCTPFAHTSLLLPTCGDSPHLVCPTSRMEAVLTNRTVLQTKTSERCGVISDENKIRGTPDKWENNSSNWWT